MPTRGGPSKLNSFALKLVHLYAPTLVHWAHHSRDPRRPALVEMHLAELAVVSVTPDVAEVPSCPGRMGWWHRAQL